MYYDINEKSNEIFNRLKKVLNNNLPNVVLSRKNIEEKYPVVVFETRTNILSSQTQDMYRLNQTRKLSFEISIFAKNENNIDSSLICEEIANYVNYVMQEIYNMQGGIDARLYNVNTRNVSKFVLHYAYEWQTNSRKVIV